MGALTVRQGDAYCLTVTSPPAAVPIATSDPLAVAPSVRTRILDAVGRCIARFGVRKTTIDDIAGEAGCARATVYRQVGDKRAVVEAYVEAEWSSLAARLRHRVEASPSFEDALVALLVSSAGSLRDHAALQQVLEVEPEVALPYLAFDGADVTFAAVATALAPALERFVDRDRAERAAEWATRLVLSYSLDSDEGIAVVDETFARGLVRDFVAPGLAESRG